MKKPDYFLFTLFGAFAILTATAGCIRNNQVFAYVGRGVVVLAKDSKTLTTVVGSGVAAGGITALAFNWGEQKQISLKEAQALVPDWDGKNSTVLYNPEAIQVAFNPEPQTTGKLAALLRPSAPTQSVQLNTVSVNSFKVPLDQLIKAGVVVSDTGTPAPKTGLSRETLAKYPIGVATPAQADTLRLRPLIRIGSQEYRLGEPISMIELKKLNSPSQSISTETFKQIWDAVFSKN